MPDPDSDDDFRPVLLSRQGGCVVDLISPGVIRKRGRRVTRNERAALRIVKTYTNVPVPEVLLARWFFEDGEEVGSILMERIEGHTLKSVWDSFDSATKERMCFDIWAVIEQLRQIPKPPGAYQFGADGSASHDVLLKDLEIPPRPIADDAALRARINERYLHYNGGSYQEHLPVHHIRYATRIRRCVLTSFQWELDGCRGCGSCQDNPRAVMDDDEPAAIDRRTRIDINHWHSDEDERVRQLELSQLSAVSRS